MKLGRTTVGKDRLLWTIFCAMAFTTAWKQTEILWLFIVRGFVSMLWEALPHMKARHSFVSVASGVVKLVSGVHGIAAAGTISTVFLFFVKAGAFVFGSGLAIVPFLYGGVVNKFRC